MTGPSSSAVTRATCVRDHRFHRVGGGPQIRVLGQALDLLREGKAARLTVPKDDDEARVLAQAQLHIAKPVLNVCNVDEASAADGNAQSAAVANMAAASGAKSVVISAGIESDIAQMDPADLPDFLEGLGLTATGHARVVRAGYDLLHLRPYFTAGPKETRA